MPEKLFTIDELSEYLGISEEKIHSLVDEGVICAYNIGGEFLRFRKEQIDAIQSEITPLVKESDKIAISDVRAKVKERHNMLKYRDGVSFSQWISDFLYFYDFYIVSSLIIASLLVVIFIT